MVRDKYIRNVTVVEWVRREPNRVMNGFRFLVGLVNAFHFFDKWLGWRVGDERKKIIGRG